MRIKFKSTLLFISLLFLKSYAVQLNLKFSEDSIFTLENSDTTFHEIHYLDVSFLQVVFNNTGKSIPARQKYVIKDEFEKPWVFTVDNPYVVARGKTYNLSHLVRRGPNYLYVPTAPFLQLFDSITGASSSMENNVISIQWESTPKTLGANILSFEKQSFKNGILFTIHLKDKLPFQTLWADPHYIISLEGGILDSANFHNPTKWPGTLNTFQGIQEEGFAQLTLSLSGKIDTIETSYQNNDSKLVISLRLPTKKNTDKVIKLKNKKKGVKTIIIDPGHGGRDPGASFKGVKEKDITLRIAKKLKKNLKKKGFKVLLTRDKDKYIHLKDRPKFASNNSGDLFISLHCNSISGTPKKLKTVRGFVAYILRAGESEEDKALARRENQAIKEAQTKNAKTSISPVDWILLEHELNLYSHQSEKFAEKIVKYFEKGKIKKHRTGAHQAGFFVLAGAFMPAVLFEIGFLTNDKDRVYMNQKSGQEDIANRLSKSIQSFFKN